MDRIVVPAPHEESRRAARAHYPDLYRAANSLRVWGVVLKVVGACGLIVGIVWVLLSFRSHSQSVRDAGTRAAALATGFASLAMLGAGALLVGGGEALRVLGEVAVNTGRNPGLRPADSRQSALSEPAEPTPPS
jgi:hypothetical protein